MTTDAIGGVWRYAVELSRGLAERGCAVTLAVVGPPAAPSQRAELAPGVRVLDTGLPLDWLAERPADLDRASFALATLARDADVALLHAPALLRATWPVPVVAFAHSCLATWFDAVRGGPVAPEYAWRAQAAADGFRRADAVAAPTHAFAEAVRRMHGLCAVAVVHNGRDPVPGPPFPRDRVVLTAGRLWDDGKDAALLDRVAVRLSAPVRAAGPTTGPAGAAIALPNLSLLGVLGEAGMAAALARASVFASPARYEPFGLAVLEAAQAGLALVLSDIPTFRELWDGAAFFAEPGDDDAWAEALERALADPAPWAARARVRATNYSASAMVAGTAALLARVAA